jgi:branched-chain amino acid transport system substrate-binding protein
MKRSFRSVLVLSVVALIVASCGKSETASTTTTTAAGGTGSTAAQGGGDCTSASNTVKIGVITPSSTNLAALANGIINSAKLAADQANKKCAVKGFKIVVDAQDDQKTPDVGQQVATKLASDADVIGVIGTLNSSVAKTAVVPLDGANIAMISPANTGVELTGRDNLASQKRPHKNYFRVVTTDDIQGPFAADYAFDKLGKKNVAVIHDNKTYGKGLAEAFQKEFEKKGGKTVKFTTIDPASKDFRSVVSDVKSGSPDIVFYGGEYPEAGPLRAQMKELGLNIPLMGGDGINDADYIKNGGQDGDNATNPGASTTKLDSAKQYVTDYNAVYEKDSFSAYGAFSFDATNILIAAAGKALSGKTKVDAAARQATIDAVQATDYKGVTGQTKFDAFGDTSNRLITVYEVKSGKFEDVFQGTFAG